MLRSPVVRFGGKSKVASIVWERLGNPPNFVSPFFGSGGVELARPDPPRVETFNDIDCMIANFFRAISTDPETVAKFADGMSNEADLVARCLWIRERKPALRDAVMGDPHYFDAKIAGWWVWGNSCAIAGGFDADTDSRVLMPDTTGTSGVNRRSLKGISRESGSEGCGFPTITAWFDALRERLRGATIVCGSWERVMGSTTTGRCVSSRAMGMSPTGIFFDPPYPGHEDVYADAAGKMFSDVAAWCTEHGDTPGLRVCLCSYEGAWDPPVGWSTIAWKAKGGFGGQRKAGTNDNAHRERLWFSLKPASRPLSIWDHVTENISA